jgi:ribosomal protein S18 acetylase RimI-like enzyme
VIRRIRRNLSERGLRENAARFVVLAREGFISQDFIVLSSDLVAVPDLSRRAELSVEEMGEQHLPELSELNRRRGEPGADAYFAATLAEGVHGLVAYEGQDLIGYIQWVDARTPHHDLWFMGPGFELRPGDAYLSGLFLLPVQRGRGVGSAFLAAFETRLREAGHRRAFCFVESSNDVARRLYDKHGWKALRSVGYRRLIFARWRRVDVAPPL